jgi:tetratricopeptide (TPR) repeat protein
MSRPLLSAALAAVLAAPLPAQSIDAQTNTPYDLTVVLRVRPHRLLTDAFRDQLYRELTHDLRAALGPLASVKVQDPDHPDLRGQWPPLWKLALDGGLDALGTPRRGPAALAACTGVKTHFVVLEYADGRYELSARQHDGSTGLVSPLVRRAATTDRPFVARLAGLLIGQDFGAVGTLEAPQPGDVQKLRLRASGLGPLGEWVQKGDVFALARLTPGGPGQPPRGTRVDDAILQVTDGPAADGTYPARLISRRLNPLAGGAGVRAVRLGTTPGPLHLRLVDERGLPLKNLQVRANASGFQEGGPVPAEQVTVGPDGVLRSEPRGFPAVAFVHVYAGGQQVARVPVPILAGATATVELDAARATGRPAALADERRQLVAALDESLLVLADRQKQLSEVIKKSGNVEGRKHAAQTRALLDAEIEAHRAAIARLAASAADAPGGPQEFVKPCRDRLDALADARQRVEETIKKFDEVVRQENDPVRKAKREALARKLAEAAAAEQEDDLDRAITLYEEALKDTPDDALKAKVARLRAGWAVKDEAHRKARAFVTETWPKVATVEDLRAQLPEARKALETFARVNDPYSPRKLSRATLAITKAVREQHDGLTPDEKTKERLQQFEQAIKDLNALHESALAQIKAAEPPPAK